MVSMGFSDTRSGLRFPPAPNILSYISLSNCSTNLAELKRPLALKQENLNDWFSLSKTQKLNIIQKIEIEILGPQVYDSDSVNKLSLKIYDAISLKNNSSYFKNNPTKIINYIASIITLTPEFLSY
jgi:hypothetical protein